MSTENEILGKLGEVLAGQAHIGEEQTRIRNDMKEVTLGLGAVKTEVGILTANMANKSDETNRRFGEQQIDIDRAHDKAGRAYEKAGKVPQSAPTSFPIVKTGVTAGGGGVFVIVCDWLTKYFTGTGGAS